MNRLGQSFAPNDVSEAFSVCLYTLSSLEGRELSWITVHPDFIIRLFRKCKWPGHSLMDCVGMFILKSFIFIDSFDTTHLGCMQSKFPLDYKLISFMNLLKDAGLVCLSWWLNHETD